MKIFVYWFLVLGLLFSGCAQEIPPAEETITEVPAVHAGEPIPEVMDAPEPLPTRAELLVSRMDVAELVGQMLLVRCPATDVEEILAEYQFGGLVLFSRDIDGETPNSLAKKLESYQHSVSIPLIISVDEEGGTVTRVSRNTAFRSTRFPSPKSAYQRGGLAYLLEIEAEKAKLLSTLGINVNLAPVCDVVTDPRAFLYDRSLCLSADGTAECIAAMVQTASENNVGSVLKHFPGYGNCDDTHIGTALDDRSLEDFYSVDFVPFKAGIQAGAGGIMVCHNIVTCMDAGMPASLSPEVHRILRTDLGFTGVIITDDMAMDAISGVYGEGEAAVLAVLAGNDMLCTSSYKVQYQAILEAVEDGRISVSQLRQSVLRIMEWKTDLGLI